MERDIHTKNLSSAHLRFREIQFKKEENLIVLNCQLIHLIFPCAFLCFSSNLRILFVKVFIECVNLDLGKSKGELREFYVKREKKREGEIEN